MKEKLAPYTKKTETLLQKTAVQVILLFSLVFLRYLFFGFEYYYMLDDYIQHHNYATGTQYEWTATWNFLNQMGLLSYRPLAGILDLSLWSLLFEEMIWGVALLSLLYAWAAVLFYQLLQQFFSCSPLFLVICTMIPLGFEGTYWMSASSRVVPGLFFTALTAWYFHKFCEQGKKRDFCLFFLFQCLSYGFYEQCLVHSITCVGLLSIYHFFYHRKRSFWGFSFLGSLGIYWLVTHAGASTALFTNRTEIILPSPYYFNVFLPELLNQLKFSFLYGGFYTIFNGFFRGIQMIFQHSGYFYFFLSILLSSFLFLLPKQKKNKPETATKAKLLPDYVGFIVGFLLFLAPISIFFVIANPWFGLRNTVCSFWGIALMIDLIWKKIADKIPQNDLIKGEYFQIITAVALCFLSLIASVSEISDYKDTYEDDFQVISSLYPVISQLDSSLRVGVLGVEPSFLTAQNFSYHEHLHGVTESDWALSGAMIAYANGPVPTLVPIPVVNQSYYPYHGGSKRPGTFDALYYYNHNTGEVISLTFSEYKPEEEYHFYDPEGNLFAVLQDWLDNGYLFLE